VISVETSLEDYLTREEATIRDAQRELFSRRGGLAEFTRYAWDIFETRACHWNWHMDFMCNGLEGITFGDFRNLLINVPPGTTKTILCSIVWPVWSWIIRPDFGLISGSYSEQLAVGNASDSLKIAQHPWYRDTWPECQIWNHDADRHHKNPAKGEFYNRSGGMRLSTTPLGGSTGYHADTTCIDDPCKPMDIWRELGSLDRVWEWISNTLPTRCKNKATFSNVLVMQRLHENDPSGRIINKGTYQHICLPMEFVPDKKCITSFGEDPRTEEGELLDPKRFSKDVIAELKTEMSSVEISGQLQQDPMPKEGSFFGNCLPTVIESEPRFSSRARRVWSWDAAFKNLATSDFVAGVEGVEDDGVIYITYGIIKRLSFSSTVEVILECSKRPAVMRTIIEDKANGTACEDVLRSVATIQLVNPLGGKLSRAHACLYKFESKRVVLVNSGPWCGELLKQLERFPLGGKDDGVDALTQIIMHFDKRSPLDRLRQRFGE
jgi:predicted phage terminase large subunit-like protein